MDQRIVNLLKESGIDRDMSFGAAVDVLQDRVLKEQEIKDNTNARVQSDFKDKFLMRVRDDDSSLFGTGVEVFYVDNLVVGAKDTSFIQHYNLIGRRVAISQMMGVKYSTLTGSERHSLTEGELRACRGISEEEYKQFLEEVKTVENQVNVIINQYK